MKVYAENGVLDRCRRLLLVSRWSLYWSFCASKNENRWTLWLVDGQSLTPVLLLELHELFLPIQDLKAWSESFADLDSVTVFENHNKSRIQHCERSELRLHFQWTKLIKNAKNSPFWRVFWKPKACGQTVLPERTKIGGTCQSSKIQMRHFDIFSNSILGFFFMIFEHCVMFTKWFLDLNLGTLLFALKS